jgi:hypothetical protein
VAGILVCTVIFFKIWNRPNEEMQNRKPDAVTTASNLTIEFANMPQKASEKYKDKIIQLSGQPNEIETDRDRNVHFFFINGKVTVQCTLEKDERLPKVRKDDSQITLKGRFAGMDTLLGITVKLYNCVVVRR